MERYLRDEQKKSDTMDYIRLDESDERIDTWQSTLDDDLIWKLIANRNYRWAVRNDRWFPDTLWGDIIDRTQGITIHTVRIKDTPDNQVFLKIMRLLSDYNARSDAEGSRNGEDTVNHHTNGGFR